MKMNKDTWLADWASTITYESTDDLFRHIFNDMVLNCPFPNTRVVYGPCENDENVVIELIGEVNSTVTLPKK